MAITTYSELKTAVANWLDRTDLTSRIPEFIALAEADIRIDVRCRAMEALASGTLSGSTLAFPTRYLESRRFVVDGKNLVYVSPEVFQKLSDDGATQDVYSIIGETFYTLNGASGDTYSLLYWASFAAMSADADTNWLLTNAPGAYLFAALKHAAIFEQAVGAPDQFAAQYMDVVGRLTSREKQTAVSGSALVQRQAISER